MATSDNIVTVELSSWADFKIASKFDAIVSVGAMEHFASLECRKKGLHIDVYRNFFRLCFNISKSQSFLGLQTIATLKSPNSRQTTILVGNKTIKLYQWGKGPTILLVHAWGGEVVN
ncbi:MAG: hypothetical protein HKM04_07765 [Legionellales bacterium]|nr:hypothetical protein [Legionellales bacterium]